MNYFVFDTETSGFGKNAISANGMAIHLHDEVIQFAGLLLDEDFRLKKVINFHCYTAVPIQPKAQAVNHLSHEILMKYSGGKTFEDYFLNLSDLHMDDLTWIGYNVSFDTRMVNSTLKHNGLPEYDFGTGVESLRSAKVGRHYFDLLKVLAMKNGGIRMKLTQAANHLPYSGKQIEGMYKKILCLTKSKSTLTFHDALYDALVTWLLVVQNKECC